MDFSLLKSFIAVADERSFSTAAQHLFISQQSLSKQIAKLEEELGTPLFIRSRPLALTQDGMNFLRTARGIMALKQQYEESCSKRLGDAQYIHLGIEHSIARAMLPQVLPQFLGQHPKTYLKLSEASPDLLQKAIGHDGVDLVIGSIQCLPETHETVVLCEKPMLLVVPKHIMEKLAGDRLEEKLRERIGFGTIFDALIVGNTVQFFNDRNPFPLNQGVLTGIPIMLVGFVFMAVGQWIYMSGAQCCGPRDALLVGLGKRLPKVPIGLVEVGLWALVVLAGWLLGGPVGVGTLFSVLGAGLVMQLVCRIVHFEPRSVRNRDVIEVIRILSSESGETGK